MKRLFVFALLVGALLASTASATDLMNNKYGTITISDSGIVSKGSQLVYFEGIVPPAKEALGSVSFTVGELISGTIEGGGIFSHVDSSFVVVGDGYEGVPSGTIFAGHFDGEVHWTLLSQQGPNLIFSLRGNVTGVLYTGETVSLDTNQTMATTVQEIGNGKANIVKGKLITYP